MAHERTGKRVGSPKWIVDCSEKVNSFRKALSPEEAELFNECLLRIGRNPHVDGIHKFRARTGLPLVNCIYRDDHFMMMYYSVNNPGTKIYVFRAARIDDFGQS